MPIGYLSRISHTFIYELSPSCPREESDWIVRSPASSHLRMLQKGPRRPSKSPYTCPVGSWELLARVAVYLRAEAFVPLRTHTHTRR